MSTSQAHLLALAPFRGVVRRALVLTILLLSPLLTGCLGGSSGAGQGVVVTSQPLIDAFQVLGRSDALVGVPDWAILDRPLDAQRLGRPFAIPAEEVLALGPRLVIDHPHPLVAGPDRQTLRTTLAGAGIEVQVLGNAPNLATAKATLWAAGNATGTDPTPAIHGLEANLTDLEARLADLARPKALVLFPAGLVAGEGTDADAILALSGMRNAAAMAGLEGYRQITQEAIQRTGVDLVIATATMRQSPESIARRPMFRGTAVADAPERVLVVDPSRTTRMGPHVDQAATMLATWAHPDLGGPGLRAWLEPTSLPACGQTTLHAPGNATVTAELAGHRFDAGRFTVPDLPPGHYRLQVHAEDQEARLDLMLTLEGSSCDA